VGSRANSKAILSSRSTDSEGVIQPVLAPYTAAGTKSANIIHPAGTASITAPALCSGAFVSPFVTQKGFMGAAKLYPALTHSAPNATTAAKSIVTR
jgi:hypothetical protein